MPDAQGNLKGSGWSRKREEGWERAFASPKLSAETIETIAKAARLARELSEPPEEPDEAR